MSYRDDAIAAARRRHENSPLVYDEAWLDGEIVFIAHGSDRTRPPRRRYDDPILDTRPPRRRSWWRALLTWNRA